jgi:subtilisin family serine protease
MTAASARSLVCVLLAGATATAAAAPPWQVSVSMGERVPTSVSVLNRCFAAHTFGLDRSSGLEWLRFTGEPRLSLAPGETRELPAVVDATLLEPGIRAGGITATCLDCALEPGCGPERIDAELKVLWTAGALGQLAPDSYVPGQVLVLLRPMPAAVRAIAIDALAREYALQQVQLVELAALAQAVVLYQVARSEAVPGAVVQIQNDPRLDLVQPNFRYTTAGRADPHSELQFGPRRMRADIPRRQFSGRGVRIAVIDSGVDIKHPDLRDAAWETRDFTGSGYSADAHGTSVAGIVAARADNGIGIYGLAPRAQFLALKACVPREPGASVAACTSVQLAPALDYALVRQARIANLSVAGPRDPLLAKMVRHAVARGTVIVAAGGNAGPGAPPSHPAAMEEAIAVSAIDARDQLLASATRGAYLDLAAPGVDVLTTLPGERYGPSTGTSFAAAHVTAAAALLLEKSPGLTPAQVRQALEAAAVDLGARGRDDSFGSGVVDLCRLLELRCLDP